jgi:hypothetical protein
MANIVPTFLSKLNLHEKDQYISFQEEGYKFTIQGQCEGIVFKTIS